MTRNPNLDSDRGVRAADLDVCRKQAEARGAENLPPIIAELRVDGVTSLRGIARALNERGVSTATRKIPQVRRVLARLK